MQKEVKIHCEEVEILDEINYKVFEGEGDVVDDDFDMYGHFTLVVKYGVSDGRREDDEEIEYN